MNAGLRVGAEDADYRCAGRGHLVLALSRRDDARFARHCDMLAVQARVVVPVLETAPVEVGEWLGGLLDAFGSRPATIVADDSTLADALRLALACPERVADVRLLVADGVTPHPEPILVPFAVERYIQ